jgi:hypothetical protein
MDKNNILFKLIILRIIIKYIHAVHFGNSPYADTVGPA